MTWNTSSPVKRAEVIERLRERGYLAIPTTGQANCRNVVRVRYLDDCDTRTVEGIVKSTDRAAIPVFALPTFERSSGQDSGPASSYFAGPPIS